MSFLLLGIAVISFVFSIVLFLVCINKKRDLTATIREQEDTIKEQEEMITKYKRSLDEYDTFLYSIKGLSKNNRFGRNLYEKQAHYDEENYNGSKYRNVYIILRIDEHEGFGFYMFDLKLRREVCRLKCDIINKPSVYTKRYVLEAAYPDDDVMDAHTLTGKMVFEKTVNDIKKINLHELSTDKDARRKGLATILLKHLVRFCKLHGYRSIYGKLDLGTDIGIENLRKFYEKLCFETNDTMFELMLDKFDIKKLE
ncbi:MAG: GNAT family N-acetyltransferase [Defluviitaleaceae bacterium]|nr:GNAT family N-acetyltransferase [Defluviitaleaceae bacterium]